MHVIIINCTLLQQHNEEQISMIVFKDQNMIYLPHRFPRGSSRKLALIFSHKIGMLFILASFP